MGHCYVHFAFLFTLTSSSYSTADVYRVLQSESWVEQLFDGDPPRVGIHVEVLDRFLLPHSPVQHRVLQQVSHLYRILFSKYPTVIFLRDIKRLISYANLTVHMSV